MDRATAPLEVGQTDTAPLSGNGKRKGSSGGQMLPKDAPTATPVTTPDISNPISASLVSRTSDIADI